MRPLPWMALLAAAAAATGGAAAPTPSQSAAPVAPSGGRGLSPAAAANGAATTPPRPVPNPTPLPPPPSDDRGGASSGRTAAIAQEVLSTMDATADPCQDAYQWACGGWVAAHTPRPSQPVRLRVWDAIGIEAQLDGLLRGPALGGTKAGTLYAACMDGAPQGDDLSPLAPHASTLQAMVTNGSYAAVIDTVASLHAAAAGEPLVDYKVSQSVWEMGVVDVIAWPPPPFLVGPFANTTAWDRRGAAAHESMLTGLAAVAIEAGLLGRVDGESAEAVVAEAATYERQVNPAKARRSSGGGPPGGVPQTARASHMAATTRQAESQEGSLLWDLSSALVTAAGVGPGRINLDTYGATSYARSLQAWIDAAAADGGGNGGDSGEGGGLAPLRAYLSLQATRAYAEADLLGPGPRAIIDTYAAAMKGTTAPPPRRDRCTARVANNFPTSVGTAYVAAHLPDPARQAAADMAGDVRAAYERVLNTSGLDNPTLIGALGKLAAMRLLVGEAVPAEGREDTSGVAVNRTDWPASYISATARGWRDKWGRAVGPADGAVALQPATVKAIYDPPVNTVIVSPGTYHFGRGGGEAAHPSPPPPDPLPGLYLTGCRFPAPRFPFASPPFDLYISLALSPSHPSASSRFPPSSVALRIALHRPVAAPVFFPRRARCNQLWPLGDGGGP